jgi:hypothetical protein
MASIAQTVGSFDKVLASCNALGARYQPKATALTSTALSQLLERAQQSIEAVTVTRTAYRLAVNNRSASFAGLPKLAVRIVRMIAASENSPKHIADAVAIKNKFYRAKEESEGCTGSESRRWVEGDYPIFRKIELRGADGDIQ